MTDFHPAYRPEPPEPACFDGDRSDLQGGERLGRPIFRLDALEPGDIVTLAPDKMYYYDPELRIEGLHFARTQDGWLRLDYRRPS